MQKKMLQQRHRNLQFIHLQFLKLQQILADRGYYGGAIDGMLGPNMRKAIRMFQRDNKMITDGYPNGEVLLKLDIYNKELK